jgi:bisphosphoglycerate-dependent phosphoglycerate mutase
LSQIESCDDSIELTKEQVKAALTSLISNHKQTRTVASRKRRRNESIEKPTKKSKPIYNDIIISNINQPETIVLATSGLNQRQMVSVFSSSSSII